MAVLVNRPSTTRLPKVYKPPKPKRSSLQRIAAWANSHSWLWGLIWAVISLLVVQFQLWRQSQTVFGAECSMAQGQPASLVSETTNSVSIALGVKCAVRNLGNRAADLVDARTALLFDGVLAYTPEPTPREYEAAGVVIVNDERFTRPVTIQPGSQANVEMRVQFPFHREPAPKLFDALIACDRSGLLKTAVALDACLRNAGSGWTDYLRGDMRSGYVFIDSFGHGLGGLFMLSSGTFVTAEVPFLAGFGWTCNKPGLMPLPPYVDGMHRRLICKDFSKP